MAAPQSLKVLPPNNRAVEEDERARHNLAVGVDLLAKFPPDFFVVRAH